MSLQMLLIPTMHDNVITQVKEVFGMPGGPEGVIHLLGTATEAQLVVETAWVVCHATHSPADANRLVHLGLIQAAVQQACFCTQQVTTPLLIPFMQQSTGLGRQ